MCMTSYFQLLSRSAHPKKDGGVAKNLVIANAFKSENPLFTVIMLPSYVNGKDRASLPQDIINYLPRDGFTKDYTKASILPVKLQIVDRLWPVKLYIYERSGGSSCVVSAGWSAFVRENSLQVADVCIFELIMRDSVVLNVHIFKCQD
uniref:TF-B3 domain-containing protein n=1 Tax=Quercus lobata TaxID=97700 RepID=A0A7N2LWL0_QUELO